MDLIQKINIGNEMHSPEIVPEVFAKNGIDRDNTMRPTWIFPIDPRQIMKRLLLRVESSLNYIYENCEVTYEPEDLANYTGHGTGQHVRPDVVEDLKKMKKEAAALWDSWHDCMESEGYWEAMEAHVFEDPWYGHGEWLENRLVI